MGYPQCGWLPWYGSHRPLKPASERDLEAAFVGRVTAHRTMRQWFASFLSGSYPFSRREDLPFEEMLDFYDRALVVPNESIFGEVNFRTFEAASCGCAVVNPDLDDAVSELFADGEEQLLYSDVLELEEHIDRLLGDTGLAVRMGRAARERVVRDHLPEHRAKRVLAMASELGGISRSRSEVDLLLTLHGLALRGEHLIGQDSLERSLASLPATPESLGALIQSAAKGRSPEKVMSVVLPILDRRQYEEELEVNVAGSTACLAVGEWATAVQFWFRHLRGCGTGGERPNDPGRLYALWARELSRSGRTLRPGLMFDPKTHLPETALECLVMAHERSPDDMGILRSLDALARDVKGMEPLRMQLLSHQSLHDQESWRIGLELALVNLKAFRKREGLEELELAFALARKRSKEGPFLSMLMSRDHSGRILRALKETIARGEGRHMLEYLRIRNLALIEDMELEFCPGLNVLTGESGAGKSFILRALDFIVGERLSPSLVRPGQERALVEALFVTAEGELILRRELSADSGRSRVFVNDALSGQERSQSRRAVIAHAHQPARPAATAQALLPRAHRRRVHRVSGSADREGQAPWALSRSSTRRWMPSAADAPSWPRKGSCSSISAGEIAKVDPRPGEEEELAQAKERIRRDALLQTNVQHALELLFVEDGGLADRLQRLQRLLLPLVESDDAFTAHIRGLEDARELLRDLQSALLKRNSGGGGQAELEGIESRLWELSQLRRKLKRSLDEIVGLRQEIDENLSFLDQATLEIKRWSAARGRS
jgi:hypothetical protein